LERVASTSYSAVEEILKDIDSAVSDALAKLDLPDDSARSQYLPISPDKNERSLKALAFKKKAHELVRKELGAIKKAQQVNGSSDGTNSSIQVNADLVDKKVVLTLYGNAPQAKQLFSSLQLAKNVPGGTHDVLPVLREAGLPPGITTTQVVAIQSTGMVDDKKRVKTLGELFTSPSNARPFEPPRPSKIATTRDTKVGWYQPASADAPPRSSSYFEQKVTNGQWIDYSNAGPAHSTKRKRDRAMSLGGSKVPQIEAEPVESEVAKVDALFRSAYTSFAPTKDNSAAIVPDGLVAKLWWQHVGEKSFTRFVENATAMDDINAIDATEEEPAGSDDQIESFREAVEWYETQAVDPSLQVSMEKSAEEKDVEEVLEGISELIETLNSYQRIRNMSLNPPSRASGLLSAPDAGTTGTPAKPSEAEMATYEILKSQLTLMISSLPPFAVAKLNPDQLSELNVSTKLPIQLQNYHGVMEEDEAASKAKQAMLPVTASRTPQPTAAQRTSSTPSYNASYPSRAPAPIPQYYAASQTPIRQPATMQRPPATAPAPYPLQRPASGVAPYRPQSYGTPTYAHQGARPVQQQIYNTPHFGGSSSGSYSGTPTQGYARPVGQPYQNSPQIATQTSTSNRYSAQPSYNQAVPAANGVATRYNNGNIGNTGRQPSPSHSGWGARQPEYDYTNRSGSYSTGVPTYPSSSQSMMPNQRAYQASSAGAPTSTAMMNGASQSPQPQPAQQHAQQQALQAPQPSQPQQALGATSYSTYLSHEQQHNIMERQRAALAAHQSGAQQQARQAVSPSQEQAQLNGSTVIAGS